MLNVKRREKRIAGGALLVPLCVALLLIASLAAGRSKTTIEEIGYPVETGSSLRFIKASDFIQNLFLTDPIKIWEAYAKGYATIRSSLTTTGSPLGVTVENSGPVSIIIDEYVMALSPSPAYPGENGPGDDETQDAVLTITHILPPGESLTYYYGTYVLYDFLPPPPWWCTEDSEFTKEDVTISLGGEILPFVMEGYVESGDIETQQMVWTHLRENPTLVVGKLPFWKEIPAMKKERIPVEINVTNLGFIAAGQVFVEDILLPGYGFDGGSFDPPPYSTEMTPQGGWRITWLVDGVAGAVETPEDEPTIYTTERIEYVMVTPKLEEGRYFLPRAAVDQDGDGSLDAHSEEPLLEVGSFDEDEDGDEYDDEDEDEADDMGGRLKKVFTY